MKRRLWILAMGLIAVSFVAPRKVSAKTACEAKKCSYIQQCEWSCTVCDFETRRDGKRLPDRVCQ